MKTRYFGALLTSLLILTACKPEGKPVGLAVEGRIEEYANAKVYLDEALPGKNQVVDSAMTDEQGHFVLHTGKESEGIYSVRLNNQQSLLVYAEKASPQISANAGQFSRGAVAGNVGSKVLQDFNAKRSRLRADYVRHNRSLNAISREMQAELWSQTEMQADIASEAYRDYVTHFVDTVSLPAIADYAVYNLNIEGDFYYIQQYLEAQKAANAPPSAFRTALAADLAAHGDYFLRMQASDFKLPNAKGDSISLSDFRGKPVFFFVWASYCGMSRMENARLSAWYRSMDDPQVEILSYSIELDERTWHKAILDDSLVWAGQVRGENEWSSAELKEFGVKHIPVAFLLDAKGIIRTKGIHASELARDYDKIVAQWGAK